MAAGGEEAQSGGAVLGPSAWQAIDRLPSDLVERNTRFAERALNPGEDRPLVLCDGPVVDAASPPTSGRRLTPDLAASGALVLVDSGDRDDRQREAARLNGDGPHGWRASGARTAVVLRAGRGALTLGARSR